MKCRDCTNLHLIKECKNLLWCEEVLDAPCPDTERECQYFKRATNYDRIISKSPEELAIWMNSIIKERYIEVTCDGWLDWLKKEVSDGS